MNIDQEIKEVEDGPMQEIAKAIPDTPIAPAHGIAAIALNTALKYHDMCMIPDGLTYQQYKMEGRNIKSIGLEDVFETAIKIELYLLGASERIAKVVVEAIEFGVKEDEEEHPPQEDNPNLPDAEGSDTIG